MAFILYNRSAVTDADTPELTVSCQSQKDTSRSQLASLSVIAVANELSLLGLSQVRGLWTSHFLLSTACPAHLKVILIPISSIQRTAKTRKFHNIFTINYSQLIDTLMQTRPSVLNS